MDSNPTPQCRLCLETSDDLVNIFDSFQDSTIASILTQHFWFQVHKNDGLSECLCRTCWTNTRTFHNFYTKIETRHRDNWFSVNSVAVGTNYFSVSIKQERSDSPEETAALEPDLNIVKYEEPPLEVIDIRTSQVESSDCNDDRSEYEETSDDDDQPCNKKRKYETSGMENHTLPYIVGYSSSNTQSTSQYEADKGESEMGEAVDESFSTAIPAKSRLMYESCYKNFCEWLEQSNIETISEKVMLDFFLHKSKIQKATTLWSVYSK